MGARNSLWRVCVPRPTTCASNRDLEEQLEQLQAAQPLTRWHLSDVEICGVIIVSVIYDIYGCSAKLWWELMSDSKTKEETIVKPSCGISTDHFMQQKGTDFQCCRSGRVVMRRDPLNLIIWINIWRVMEILDVLALRWLGLSVCESSFCITPPQMVASSPSWILKRAVMREEEIRYAVDMVKFN